MKINSRYTAAYTFSTINESFIINIFFNSISFLESAKFKFMIIQISAYFCLAYTFHQERESVSFHWLLKSFSFVKPLVKHSWNSTTLSKFVCRICPRVSNQIVNQIYFICEIMPNKVASIVNIDAKLKLNSKNFCGNFHLRVR